MVKMQLSTTEFTSKNDHKQTGSNPLMNGPI
jgi:hypothetical protein